MKITIHETVSRKPNGDRDTQTHPSSAFKVVLTNDKKTSVVFENNQFDSFGCHINGSRKSYLLEAQKKAQELAATLGCEVDLEPTTKPSRIAELKERIAQDSAELAKLENGHG